MKFSIFILVFLLTISGAPLYSQEVDTPGEKENVDKKEKVFVSKEIIVKDKREQPGVVSIITDREVKNSTKTDLVNVIEQNVPSFYTSNNRIMGFGVASSGAAVMSIRGIGKSGWGPTTGVPFLINGLDTTTSIMGHPIADIFKMKNIDRIEVLHGPQPVLYGSGAMGGVVNVITKRQELDGYSTELSGSYGSYNTTDDYLLHQGKMGIFDYGVSYNYQRTDGHREQTIDGHEYTSEFSNHTATARFGFEIGKYWYAGMNAYYMNQRIHNPGEEGTTTFTDPSPLNHDLEIFDITRNGVSLNIINSFDKLEGTLHVFYNYGKHETDKPRLDISTYEHEDYLYGARLAESVSLLKGNKVTLGTDVRRYGGTAENPNSVLYPWQGGDKYYVKDKFLMDTSFFGLVEQKLIDILTLSGGVRYTDNSKFGGFASWQGGIIVNPAATTKVYVSAARGFKLPDLRQLYLHGPYPVRDPNPDLDAETYLSYEAGIEQQLIENLSISLAGYRIIADNKIAASGTFPMSSSWVNLDEFQYNGLETTLKYTLLKMIGLSAGYSFIDNEYKNEKLPYVPRHKLLSGVSFEGYNVFISLNGEYINDIYADTTGSTILDDYFVLNAKVAYTFLKHYRAFVNFNNITDLDYATYEGYPMPGFTVLGGLSVTF